MKIIKFEKNDVYYTNKEINELIKVIYAMTCIYILKEVFEFDFIGRYEFANQTTRPHLRDEHRKE